MTSTLVLTVFLAAVVARAGMEYIGCYFGPWIEREHFEPLPNSNGPFCWDYCSTIHPGSTYSLGYDDFGPGGALDRHCACSVVPNLATREYIWDNDQQRCDIRPASVGSSYAVEVHKNMPAWDYIGCFKLDLGVSKPVEVIADCESLCSGFQYMLVQYRLTTETTQCSCVETSDSWKRLDSSSACIADRDWFIYQSVAQPSVAIRRAQRELARRKELQASEHICPEGTTACNVLDGDGLSYECLDTDQELESCGGCLHGQFQPHSARIGDSDIIHSRRGTDCTALPGVHPKGVTCQIGRCVAHLCEDGFVLDENTCKAV
ncbi:hypothetical protein IAT40_007257 [Kwoniella sp. CBS 6097]